MALIKVPLLSGKYHPKTKDQEIILGVEFGNGRDGSYQINIGDKVLLPVSTPQRLGNKGTVCEKTYSIMARVTDTAEEINFVDASVYVQEGNEKTYVIVAPTKTTQDTDTVRYSFDIIFLP